MWPSGVPGPVALLSLAVFVAVIGGATFALARRLHHPAVRVAVLLVAVTLMVVTSRWLLVPHAGTQTLIGCRTAVSCNHGELTSRAEVVVGRYRPGESPERMRDRAEASGVVASVAAVAAVAVAWQLARRPRDVSSPRPTTGAPASPAA